jgi:hypothetical protein
VVLADEVIPLLLQVDFVALRLSGLDVEIDFFPNVKLCRWSSGFSMVSVSPLATSTQIGSKDRAFITIIV